MAGTIKGIVVEIGGDTSGLQKALSKVNTATSSLTKELKGINSLLKLDPSNTELLSQKQEVLSENIEQTSKKLQTLESVQDQVYKKWQKYKEVKTQIDKVSESISKTEEELSKLKKEQEKAQKAFDNGKITQQQFDEINNKVKECKVSLSNLRKEQSKLNEETVSTENYRNYQREIIKTTNDLKNLQAQASKWTSAGKSLEAFGNKVTNISNKIDGLGTTLTTSLTLPVLAIGTAAVSTGNDFEAQMSRVQAIAGATGDELEQLTEQAIDLGASTSFSASEVAAGMENLASAGFTTQEIMEAMPGLLDLAASSGADLATSSEIAASAIRGFGLEASSSAHIADVFAEASARTNAQVEDMGYAMKYIAPVANTMGLKIEEVAAAIGIMSDAGIKGEQAGTTLRGALVRLTKPTDKMLGVMEELGISFYDNEGKMKSLTEMTSMLQEATKDLTDEQEQNALTTLFGTESLSGMVALINRGSGELADMTKSFEDCDGAAQDMADTMLDNTKGSIEEMSGALESAGISIQKALAPEIRDLAKWVQDLADDFNDLSDEEKNNIVKTALLVASIGPAIKILGTLGKGIGTVSKGMGTLSTAIGAFRTGAQSANVTANSLAKGIGAITSPAGLALTGITALVGGIIYLNQKAHEIPPALQEAMNEMQNYKEEHQSFREEIDKSTASQMSEITNVQKLKNELTTLVDENGNVKESYKDRVSFILKELNEALGTEYSMTGNVINQYKTLQEEIDNLILKKQAQIVLENEEAKYSKAMEDKEAAYQKMIDAQNEYNKALEGKTYEQYFEDLKQNYIDAGYTAEGAAEYAKKYMEKWVDGYKQNYEDAKQIHSNYLNDIASYENDYAILESGNNEKIQEMIRNRTYTYQQSSTDIGETINHNIQQVQYEMQQYQQSYQQDLQNQDDYNAQKNQAQVEAGQKQLETLAQQLVAMTSTTEELTPQQLEAWKALANGSFDTYSEYVSKLAPEMQTKIQEATGVVIANTPEFAKRAGEMGQQVADNFDKNADAKQSALNTLQGYYEGLNDDEKKQLLQQTVGDRADEVAKEFESGDYETSGKNVLQGLYNGLNNGTLGQNLINKAAGIAKNIAKQFNIEWDEHSPSKLMKKMAEYFLQPISTVFSKKQRGLTTDAKNSAKDIANGFNNSFNFDQSLNIPNMKAIGGKIKAQTHTVFTTPQITFNVQEMNEQNLKACFNYINKKFGSQY